MARRKKQAKQKKEDNNEPKVKWRKSNAKRLLYEDIMSGKISRETDGVDDHGEEMQLLQIYASRPAFAEYRYDKFSSPLSSLWKTICEANRRTEEDQKAYDNFKARHPPSLYSKKGYVQWQGSDA
jgi:hypothetical protein